MLVAENLVGVVVIVHKLLYHYLPQSVGPPPHHHCSHHWNRHLLLYLDVSLYLYHQVQPLLYHEHGHYHQMHLCIPDLHVMTLQ